MKIKAILFDMDGTLVDSERYYTDGTYRWMQRAGYKGSKEAIYPIIGTTLPMTYAIIHKLLDGRLSVEEIEKFDDLKLLGEYLKQKTFAMRNLK